MKRILIILSLVLTLNAQTFVPNITIEGQNLNPQEQRIISELKNTMERYILSNSFSNERYDLQVPYYINIFVTQLSRSGSSLNVTTNAFFSNGYDQRYIDNNWNFEFTEGEIFYREMRYHPLRDMIDYYGYLIMATEMDGIEELGGNSLFDFANEIYSRGSNSQWSRGWNARKDDFDVLTGDFRLRRARYLYNQAFWAINDGEGTVAWRYLRDALSFLVESKSLDSQNKFLNFFIEKHYQDSEYFVTIYQDTTFLPFYRALSPSNNDYFDRVAESYDR